MKDDTSPQMPRAKRKADSDASELAETIPPDARIPSEHPEFLGLAQQALGFMNRTDARFFDGDKRMDGIELSIAKLGAQMRERDAKTASAIEGMAATIKTHVETRDRFMMACTMVAAIGTAISACILTMFFLIKMFGMPDLALIRIVASPAQAQQQTTQE